MSDQSPHLPSYERYHIETKPAPDIVRWPNQFLVEVNKLELARLLIKEIFEQQGDLKAITSRPCIYGVFSGPVGGFAPRPQHCVGCLRCTTQHPEVVQIHRNPEREKLGDTFFESKFVDTVAFESETGSIPVKGAGYRGKFGGQGWDGMWTDMSEIVRPTRDGIHGREYISTTVDIGETPPYLVFDEVGSPTGWLPNTLSIPIPYLLDAPPKSAASNNLFNIISDTARETQTLAIIPLDQIQNLSSIDSHIIPIQKIDAYTDLFELTFSPQIIELESHSVQSFRNIKSVISEIQSKFQGTRITLRMPYPGEDTLLNFVQSGVNVFHFVADYHGRGRDNKFVMDLIREAHLSLVKAGIRDQVTLIGSGGIIAAEHVPKAIITGLDIVALDTPVLVALQTQFDGECSHRENSIFTLPDPLPHEWGVQRLKNMLAAWRDQLLEILGAMGLREVRRLRGETGRAMYQINLEREAFSEIEGYENRE
ncbi:MAG: glutamate synthase-related protein [Anaerolineales bacterium]|jgi:hypothetical protein